MNLFIFKYVNPAWNARLQELGVIVLYRFFFLSPCHFSDSLFVINLSATQAFYHEQVSVNLLK